ncbi:hypothetical protein Csa_019169, partial [Cucumis sativus]
TNTIISSLVSLPDGTVAFPTMEGHATLCQRVLLSPAFQHNLILMSQLIDDANCVVRFTLLCVQHMTNILGASLVPVDERMDSMIYVRCNSY